MMANQSRRALLYVALLAGPFLGTLMLTLDAQRPPGPPAREDAAIAEAVMPNSPDAVSPEVAPPASDVELSDVELVRLAAGQADQQRRAIVLSPQELKDSAWAIDALAAAPTAASVAALEHLLATSGDHRERMQAVLALERMAAAAENRAVVRPALVRAIADPDPAVAARARRAVDGG